MLLPCVRHRVVRFDFVVKRGDLAAEDIQPVVHDARADAGPAGWHGRPVRPAVGGRIIDLERDVRAGKASSSGDIELAADRAAGAVVAAHVHRRERRPSVGDRVVHFEFPLRCARSRSARDVDPVIDDGNRRGVAVLEGHRGDFRPRVAGRAVHEGAIGHAAEREEPAVGDGRRAVVVDDGERRGGGPRVGLRVVDEDAAGRLAGAVKPADDVDEPVEDRGRDFLPRSWHGRQRLP